jgi:tetratricopeptide (TPR) repeat protein
MSWIVTAGKLTKAVIDGTPVLEQLAKPFTGIIDVATTLHDIKEGKKTTQRIDDLQSMISSLKGNLNDYVKRDDPLIQSLEGMVSGIPNSFGMFREIQQDRKSILFPDVFGDYIGHILANPHVGAKVVGLEEIANDAELSFLIVQNGEYHVCNVPIDKFAIAMEYLKIGKEKEELVGIPIEGSSLVIPKKEIYTADGKSIQVSVEHTLESKIEKSKRFFESGKTKSDAGDHQGAIEDYNQAIELNPEDVIILSRLALEKTAVKDYLGAIVDCEKGISIVLSQELDSDPQINSLITKKDNLSLNLLYSTLAYAKKLTKDYQGVIDAANEILKRDKNNVDAYNGRGDAKFALEDYTGAYEDFNAVVGIDPDNKYAIGQRERVSKIINLDEKIKINKERISFLEEKRSQRERNDSSDEDNFFSTIYGRMAVSGTFGGMVMSLFYGIDGSQEAIGSGIIIGAAIGGIVHYFKSDYS